MKTDKVYYSTEFDMMMINGMDVERGLDLCIHHVTQFVNNCDT